MSETSPEQRYGPSSGTATGVIGLASCAVVVAAVLAGDWTATSMRVGLGALTLALLLWAFLLRPRIIVEAGGDFLELRNPLVSRRIPLAAVTDVVVRTITTVTTAEQRYDAVAVGYPVRKVVRGQRAGGEVARVAGPGDLQAVMADRILAAAVRAREAGAEPGRVERRYAVVEIALLVVLAGLLAATFAV